MADPPSPLTLGGDPTSPLYSSFAGRWPGYEEAEKAHLEEAKKIKTIEVGLEKRRPKEEAETERAYGGAEKAIAQPRPQIPQQERVPSPPNPQEYMQMSKTYLGAMVLLAGFGGKFIRGGANAPLAAFNGAMTGWHEGNLEQYKLKSDEWKQKQQQVLDNNRARLDEYRTILEDHNASIEDQVLRVKLTAAKHQDKMFYDKAEAGNWSGIAQAYDQSVQVHEKAVKATDALVEQQTAVNETAVERANQWRDYIGTPQGQQELAELDRQSPGSSMRIKGFVKTFADAPAAAPTPPATVGAGGMTAAPAATASAGTLPPGAPAELRGPAPANMHAADRAERELRIETWQKNGREPTMEDRAENYRLQHQPRSVAAMDLAAWEKDYPATHGGRKPTPDDRIAYEAKRGAQLRAMSTLGGRMAAVEYAANEFYNMMPVMQRTSDAVARTKWVPYNSLKQKLLTAKSDPALKEFKNAVAGGITTYAGTMSRSGATTVYAQHRADEVLGTADSKEAFEAGMRILKQEVDQVRAAGPQTLYALQRIFGNDPKAIDPTARKELEDAAAGRGPMPAGDDIRYFEGRAYRRGPDGESIPVDED